MLRILLVLAFLAALAAPAALADGLTDIRVCTKDQFDSGKSECKENEAAKHPLVARDIYCSARIDAPAGVVVRLEFSTSGELVISKTLPIPKHTRTVFTHVFRTPDTIFGNQPLLGGPWKCSIFLGSQTLELPFRSGGPTQLVLDRKACPSASTVASAGWAVCPRDAGPAPMRTSQVTCSAVIAGAKGEVARVDLLRSGNAVAKVVRKVAHVSQPFSAQWRGLTAGSYACRFFLNGRSIVFKTFAVA